MPHRRRQSGQTIGSTTSIRSVKVPLCSLCRKKGEKDEHITSACEKLAQKEYKRRHDNVSKKDHWDICKKNKLEHSEKWYKHAPEGAVENEEIKVL